MSNQTKAKQQRAPFTGGKPQEATKQATQDTTQPDTVTPPVQQDPLPSMEDRKKVEFLPPHYDFAGANLGGQSVYVCGGCWALVLRDSQASHTDWHRKIED